MFEGLRNYLDVLTKDYNLQIVIKDFVGFLDGTELYDVIKAYYIHKSSYCMAIKENEKLWKYCLYNKECIYRKLSETPKAFLGTCYAGVKEYVYPILYKDKIIGAITIGGGQIEEFELDKKLKRIHKYYDMNKEQLRGYYFRSTTKEFISIEEVNKLAGIISEYISLIYKPTADYYKKRNSIKELDRTYIISHAVEYVGQHFKEDISLSKLASFCHCSNSYLSHNFKKYTGVTLKTYINQIRVDEAKDRLNDEWVSITNLAYELGFKDSNYFSKVFKDLEGVSPQMYRENVARFTDG